MPAVTTQSVIKLSFTGEAWNANEIWSFGVHLAKADGTNVLNAFNALDLQAMGNAFLNNMRTGGYPSLSQNLAFTEVRAALLQEGGKQVGDSRVWFAQGDIGGSDTSKYIPQHSIVVTLNTAERIGKTSKGRFYLPAGYGLPMNNGRIPAVDIETVGENVGAFLSAINTTAAQADPNLRLSTFSAATPNNPGLSNEITSFRIGNVVDTQRRRRNGLNEEYTPFAL